MSKPAGSPWPRNTSDGRDPTKSADGTVEVGVGEGASLVPLITSLRTAERVVLDAALFDAFQAGSSRHTLAALRSDWSAFDLWCRQHRRITVPAQAEDVAAYLTARAGGKARIARALQGLARAASSTPRPRRSHHRAAGQTDPRRDPQGQGRGPTPGGAAALQGRGLRYRRDPARGLNLRALLDSCGDDPASLRDRALLSLAYDAGLRAGELVAVGLAHILPAADFDARLLHIPRAKGDSEGEGANAFLSPRTVRAVDAWIAAAGITEGALFRRVYVRRYKARARVPGRDLATLSGREAYDWRKAQTKPAVAERTEYSVGKGALPPGSIGPIWRAIIRRAVGKGALPDLTRDDLAFWLARISGHSTRVGLNQDLFVAGEDLAGIMDTLRWKSLRMPLVYNRNLAAEHGAAGRLMRKLG